MLFLVYSWNLPWGCPNQILDAPLPTMLRGDKQPIETQTQVGQDLIWIYRTESFAEMHETWHQECCHQMIHLQTEQQNFQQIRKHKYMCYFPQGFISPYNQNMSHNSNRITLHSKLHSPEVSLENGESFREHQT